MNDTKKPDATQMSVNPKVEEHRQIILEGARKGTLGKAKAYA